MNFKKEISKVIAKAVNSDDLNDIYNSIEVPPNSELGDFSFPCFKFSKTLKKAPAIIAQELLEKIEKLELIETIKTESAYLNFYLKKDFFAKETISQILKEKEDYGKSNVGKGETVVIDYSSPNIAKPFHIGHLRTTVIGRALYNIYNFIGYKSYGINYLGDWGTQFGKLIVAYKNWGSKEAVEKDGIKELNRIYIMFHEEAEKNSKLEDDARNWLLKMQNNDEDAISLWKWFVDVSMKEFNNIYELLNIKFDSYKGESFYNDKMMPVVEELKNKNLLKESDGAMIVDLEDYNMPPCLILRRDGGTLYPTRDVAAAIYRKKTYNFVKAIYVTAFDQNLHFAQWFKVIELMGYDWAKDLIHIPYGLVSLEGAKLSTRKGHVILMEELLNESITRTLEIINEKNPKLENKEKIAKQVGIGAVIFNDLYNSRIKDIDFSWKNILNFEGETGPYVQYTYVRTVSLLKKAGDIKFDNIDFSKLTDSSSFETIKLLAAFSDKVLESANKYEPFIISRYLVRLSQSFSKFYNDNHILVDDKEIRKARLSVAYTVNIVLYSGLSILGIEAPDEM